ncbi:phage tail tip fiber protein, partial [Proteus mirabilis]
KQLSEELKWNTESIAVLTNATYSLSTDVLQRSANAQAGITQLQQLRVSDNEAWAQDIKRVYASIDENAAEVKRAQNSIVDLNKAFAEDRTRVQARFDEQEGMIQEKMQATFEQSGDGVVTHSINITIKHNGVSYNAAGQVISAQVKNGKLESFIGYNANNFAWYNPVNGKMELFMYAKNGQFFIKEAFLDKANVREMVLSEAIKSKNYELGKAGFIIDANTGNTEFNNATFRGTIDGADGNFKGTVYVEKLLGDVNSSLYFDGVENSMITGGNNYIDASVSVIYAGGMPYDVFISLPSLSIVSKSSRFITESRLHITIAEENKTIEYYDPSNQTTKEFTNNGSFGFVIKAGERNKKITITATTRGVGEITAKLKGFLIIAGKLASTSFSKES